MDRRRFVAQIVLALVVLTAVVVTVQGLRAVNALRQAEGAAASLSDAIVSGDAKGARFRLATFDDHTTVAHKSTDGPVWWAMARVPYVGRNVDALRTVAAASDAVADDVLPGVVRVTDQVRLETFRPRNGRVDLDAVRRALPVLRTADRTLAQRDRRVAAIDVDRLFPMLRDPMAAFQVKFHRAAAAAAAGHEAAQLLPPMLAERGPTRRYLLLFLNNAEVRSLSGMPGSMAVLTARRGKVKMGRQGGILDVLPLDEPALSVKRETAAGFPSTVGTDIRDVTLVPHFPRVAELAAAIVGERWEEKFDGVVAVDPVVLSYVLRGVGAIDVGDGLQLNEQNAVGTLLNGVYLKYANDPDRQDDVFELAARRSFDALVDGKGDSVRTIRGLVQGAQERRVMVWSRDDEEQARIARTGVAGVLSEDRATPDVGFFVNDSGSTKMEYYLRMSSRLKTTGCYAKGVQALRLTSTLRSEALQGGVPLPPSVVGLGQYVDPGNMLLHNLVVAPPGGRITAMWVDGRRVPVGASEYRGRQVASVSRTIPPGEATIVSVDLQTGPAASGAPTLRTTPGVVANEDSADTRSCVS